MSYYNISDPNNIQIIIMNKIVKRINPETTLLLLCDVQDKYTPKIYSHESIIETVTMFCSLANMFKIPVLITQQNPPVFGKTYKQFTDALKDTSFTTRQKTAFSMVNNNTIDFFNQHPTRNQVILIGSETHICVFQTFQDLAEKNYDVFLPVDAITSAKQIDRTVGLQRMMQSGGIVTSFQNLGFEMIKDYKNEKFKQLLNILKNNKREKIFTHL